jgi:hypothetical protein
VDASGPTADPLFRSLGLQGAMTDRLVDGRDVANLVKMLARRARLDGDYPAIRSAPAPSRRPHKAKVSLNFSARTSRHKSLIVLISYFRPAQAFDDVVLSATIA